MEVAFVVSIGWILSVCFHEFGHAIVAYWGGDKTVKEKGYLTFNIFKYTDPGMTLFFPVLILILGGIALPGAAVYINHSLLRSKMWESAVAAAGPLATMLITIIFALPFITGILPSVIPPVVWAALAYLVLLEVYAFILNSLPIPPFDGYGVIEPWLPESLRTKVASVGQYSIWIVFLVLWTVQPVNAALWNVADAIAGFLHVPEQLSAIGYALFKKNAGWLVIGLIAFLFLMRKTGKGSKSELDWYNAARDHLKNQRPIDAINALNEALTINPRFAEAWHLRGLCFGVMARNDEAMENFDAALNINPKYADCWYNRACCLALQGKSADALHDLQKAIALNPKNKEDAKQNVGFRGLWQDPRFVALVDKSTA